MTKIQPKVQQNNQTHIIPFSVLPTYFYKASIIPFGEYWDTISTDVLRSLYNSGCISSDNHESVCSEYNNIYNLVEASI